MDVSGVFEAACHVREGSAGHVLPVPNRPKENTMSEPIEPNQIRVGDTVQRTHRMVYVACTDGAEGPGGGSFVTFDESFELVSRPAPKPEVGQHWLSPDNVEWVFVERRDGNRFIGVKYDVWVAADVAPAGWTLKP